MNTVFYILLFFLEQVDSTNKIVNYSSKNIVYYPIENRIVLLDSARVSYADIEVEADSIEYDIKTKLLSAYKNVYFLTTTDKVDGIELHYNLSSKRGFMHKANTTVENGFVNGRQIWLIKEKTLEIVDGYYTTCDHDPPHYYFYARKSKVLLGNTAIAQGVVLKIHGIPCAAVPFWFFPISKERKSGLLPFKFGQSSAEGRYAKGVSYYLVINDYADMTFALDVMEKKGFQPKMEAIYIVNPFARGQILASYIHELDTKRGRYSLNAQHRSQFLFQSYLEAYVDFQSDQSYLPDYAETRAQWLKKELYSQISLNRDFKEIGRTSLLVERRQDFEHSFLEWKLPNITINFYRIPIFSDWSVTPGISFANSQKRYDSTANNPMEQYYSVRSYSGRFSLANPKTFLGAFDLPISVGYKEVNDKYGDSINIQNRTLNANTGLSSSQTILQALNISEGFGYNHAIMFTDITQANVLYNFNINSNITLFRVFGFEHFGLENILHRVTPSIGLNLTPQTKPYRLWGTPRFDTTPKAANVGLAIKNFFQGKLRKSDEKKDIATMIFQSNYDLNSKNLSPLAFNSDLYIIRETNAQLITNIILTYPWGKRPLNRARISAFSINSNFNYSFTKKDTIKKEEQGIRLTLNHFLTAILTTNSDGDTTLVTQSNMLNGAISLLPTGWSIDFTTGFNFKEKKVTDYNFSIWKDLHCWEAFININRFGTQWTYDFKVRIKKIPDVTVGKGILGFILPLQ